VSQSSSATTAGKAASSADATRVAARDERDAASASAIESADPASAAAPVAAADTAPAPAQKAAIAALAAPQVGASPAAALAVQSGSSPDDGDDSAPATDAAASRAPAPLPQPLTMAVSTPGGTAPNSQNTNDGAQNGSDPNSAAAAASMNATASAGSSHSQTQAVELQPVHAPVGSEGWSNEVGARLTLMAQQGISSASLRLSPAHLGPLEVHISVRDSSATVWFGATQTETRAALEQALPRLREMFASQGLNLANAGVSGETPRGAAQNAQPQPSPRGSEFAREVTVTPVTSGASIHQGLIDTYA
jgi:flagellar hook-length control protein FliK